MPHFFVHLQTKNNLKIIHSYHAAAGDCDSLRNLKTNLAYNGSFPQTQQASVTQLSALLPQ